MAQGFVTVPERSRLSPAQCDGRRPAPERGSSGRAGLARRAGARRRRRARWAGRLGGAAGDLEGPEASVDPGGGQLWPCLIDVHTHLDKGHTWERAENRDGTFDGAIRAVSADRAARWSADDVRRRMEFGIRCSWAHGTKAVRTHLDSFATQAAVTWPVFEALRKGVGRPGRAPGRLARFRCRLRNPRGRRAGRPGRGGEAGSSARWPACRQEIDSLLDRLLRAAPPSAGSTSTPLRRKRRRAAPEHSAHRARDTAAALPGPRRLRSLLQPRHPAARRRHRDARARRPGGDQRGQLADVQSLPSRSRARPDASLARRHAPARAGGAARSRRRGERQHARRVLMASAITTCSRCSAGRARLPSRPPLWRLAPRGDDDARRPDGPRRWAHRAGLPADLVLFEGRAWSELLSRPQANRVVVRNGRAIDRRLPDYRRAGRLSSTSRGPRAPELHPECTRPRLTTRTWRARARRSTSRAARDGSLGRGRRPRRRHGLRPASATTTSRRFSPTTAGSLRHLIKTTTYITHWGFRPLVAAARDELFPTPRIRRTPCVVVAGLAETSLPGRDRGHRRPRLRTRAAGGSDMPIGRTTKIAAGIIFAVACSGWHHPFCSSRSGCSPGVRRSPLSVESGSGGKGP